MKKFVAMLLLVALLTVSVAALATVKFTGSCYVYKKPGCGKTSTIIHKGSVMEGTMGKYWTEIEFDDGTTGWVRTKYVKSSTAEAQTVYGSKGQGKSSETDEEEEKAGKKIKATGRVHVRDAASLDSKVLGTLTKGQKLTYKGVVKYDSRGVGFYKVSYNGKTAWVSSAYAELIK